MFSLRLRSGTVHSESGDYTDRNAALHKYFFQFLSGQHVAFYSHMTD